MIVVICGTLFSTLNGGCDLIIPHCDRPPNEVHRVNDELELVVGEEFCGTLGTSHQVNLYARHTGGDDESKIFSYYHNNKDYGILDADNNPVGLGIVNRISENSGGIVNIKINGIDQIIFQRHEMFGYSFYVTPAYPNGLP